MEKINSRPDKISTSVKVTPKPVNKTAKTPEIKWETPVWTSKALILKNPNTYRQILYGQSLYFK